MEQTTIQSKTFRFSFSKEFNNELLNFSKLHQDDDRKTFKTSWEKWIDDEQIRSLINLEIKEKKRQGFAGDIFDKIYKSSRYYFRKKPDEAVEPKKRKDYSRVSKEFLKCIDLHIQSEIDTNITKNDIVSVISISPEQAYNNFCSKHKSQLTTEIVRMKSQQSPEDFVQKFKKTFKNRFYLYREKKMLPVTL
jgi:hypothetical protein